MRLAIIADTHMPRGRRRLPGGCEQLLADADLILHAGDFVGASVLDELECFGEVRAVRGNNDDRELQDRLPERDLIEVAGVRIGMVHDSGPSGGRLKRLRGLFPDADAVIFAHSHLPLHERAADGFQIFNPGSPTERRRAPGVTMGSATVLRGQLVLRIVALDEAGGAPVGQS